MSEKRQNAVEEEAVEEAASPPARDDAPEEAPAADAVEAPAADAVEAPTADAEVPRKAAEPAPEADVQHDLDELLTRAQCERDEYLALAQRTQADFENFRKRKAREVSEAEARGVAKLAKELLPALDSLELAVKHLDEGAAQGVRSVHSEFTAALARSGVEGFSPEGERFDPNEHEAMSQRAVEGAEPGTVADVFQRGYRVNGTVLRPARVVVAE
jgi:molecular chaperone GrpE